MPLGINEFIQDIQKNGFLKKNRYEVLFSGPFTAPNASHPLRPVNVTLPGFDFQVGELQLYAGAPSTPIVSGRKWQSISMSFLSRKDSQDRLFFETWADLIHDPERNVVLYYDETSATVDLTVLHESGEKGYHVRLEGVIPVKIDSTELTWSSEELMEYSVEFKYNNLKVVTK